MIICIFSPVHWYISFLLSLGYAAEWHYERMYETIVYRFCPTKIFLVYCVSHLEDKNFKPSGKKTPKTVQTHVLYNKIYTLEIIVSESRFPTRLCCSWDVAVAFVVLKRNMTRYLI